jgi:hypothetical protein
MKKILLSVLALLAFTFGGTAQTLPSYVPTNGLVGWWPFNGNANDESGNNNNGTVNGATLSADRFGNAGKAYSFDGSSDYITTNYAGVLGNGSRTICAWVKVQSISSFSTIVGYGSNTSANGGTDSYTCMLRNDGAGGIEGISLDIDGSRITKSSNVTSNTWHFYVWVFDNSISSSITDVKIYADGILQSNVAENYVPFPAAGIINTIQDENVHFGKTNSSYYLNGSLDDISIYNRALTQQEITGLYQGTNTTANCPTFPASLTQGLVGYWPFCGNALDESGNNNHGTVNGATLTTDRFGNAGSAYGFDGTNYISVIDNSNLKFSSHTISAWYYRAENPLPQTGVCANPGNEFLISKGRDIDNNSFTIAQGNTIGQVYQIIPTQVATNYSLGVWDNIIGSYDSVSNTAKFYINGILASSVNNVSWNCFSNISDLTFGVHSAFLSTSCTFFYKGKLDDIAIWNRALTPQEIQQVYNQGICQTSITVTDTLLIHTGITSYNPVAYGNTLKVWPNPGNTAITLDAGNLALMQGWKIRISNAQGAQIYPATGQSGLISQQQQTLSMNGWGGNGLYFLYLIDPQNNIQEVKKIVLAP